MYTKHNRFLEFEIILDFVSSEKRLVLVQELSGYCDYYVLWGNASDKIENLGITKSSKSYPKLDRALKEFLEMVKTSEHLTFEKR